MTQHFQSVISQFSIWQEVSESMSRMCACLRRLRYCANEYSPEGNRCRKSKFDTHDTRQYPVYFLKEPLANVTMSKCDIIRGDLQKTILLLCTPTHVTIFAAARPCLVARVTKKRLAKSLYGRHEDFCLLRG